MEINAANASCTLIRDAYLKNGDFNVIVVDWHRYAKLVYLKAKKGSIETGLYVAKMIDFLTEHANLTANKISVIGHSLGAHVMGIAAYNAKSKIDYAVGLDPASPFFRSVKHSLRISIEDARLVEIIHTNGKILGLMDSIGHVDFYPNGGIYQPGCKSDACAHNRAYEYFAESINSDVGFYGRQCISFEMFEADKCTNMPCEVMGGLCITDKAPGKYYLKTNNESPFAKND